jgi:hypothetical protein
MNEVSALLFNTLVGGTILPRHLFSDGEFVFLDKPAADTLTLILTE